MLSSHMPDEQTPTIIRLNILGPPEIERDGEPLPLPDAAAAHHLLALLAVKDRYEDQHLVDILWPGDSLTDARIGVPKAVRARLDRAVSDARAALGVRASSGVLKRQHGIVHRVRGNDVTITTDLDDFHRLSQSDRADDWLAALALVRGPIAQHVPTRNMRRDWIADQEGFQLEQIAALLKRLDPDAADETIQHRVQEVLDGRWLPPAAETNGPPEPDTATPTAAKRAPNVTVQSLPPSELDSSTNPKRQRLAKRYVASAVIAIVLTLVGIVLLVYSARGTSTPPRGSVIDADTGAIVAHPKIATSKFPAQLEFGPLIFLDCDLSAGSCGNGHHGPTPLKVKVGDIVAFRVTLNDGTSSQIHYLKLEALSQRRIFKALKVSSTELEVRMSVKWPEVLGPYEVVNEPGFIHHHISGGNPPIQPLYLQLSRPGDYHLVYIPGSTTLANKETHFSHDLPDGIMNEGIELENVGPPPSCFWCAQQYIRYVYFHMRVTSNTK
jgi:hypothetical protein